MNFLCGAFLSRSVFKSRRDIPSIYYINLNSRKCLREVNPESNSWLAIDPSDITFSLHGNELAFFVLFTLRKLTINS